MLKKITSLALLALAISNCCAMQLSKPSMQWPEKINFILNEEKETLKNPEKILGQSKLICSVLEDNEKKEVELAFKVQPSVELKTLLQSLRLIADGKQQEFDKNLEKESSEELYHLWNTANYFDIQPLLHTIPNILGQRAHAENTLKKEIIKQYQEYPHDLQRYITRSMYQENSKLFESFYTKTLTINTRAIKKIIQLENGLIASYSNNMYHDPTIHGSPFKIWDLKTGACLQPLTDHPYCLRSIIQLSNGYLASCSDDPTINIWDLKTGNCLQTLMGHTRCVNSIIQLSNGHLASCSHDNTIKIWDLNTGKCLQTLTGHTDWILSIIQLSNGNLASCSHDNTIKIWNLNTGKCLQTLTGHTDWILSIIQLSNGNLASCSHDNTIKIWNLNTGNCLQTLMGHTRCVNSIIQLSNGHLASCSGDKTIKIWDLKTGQCLQILTGHADWIHSIIQLSNGHLASCSSDKTIKIWDLKKILNGVTCDELETLLLEQEKLLETKK